MAPKSCAKCWIALRPGEQYVSALGRIWHTYHFRCTRCSSAIQGGSFHKKGDAPFCAPCFREVHLPKCTGCQKPISVPVAMVAEGGFWHVACFTCAVCQQPIGSGNSYYKYRERVLCRGDFLEAVADLAGGDALQTGDYKHAPSAQESEPDAVGTTLEVGGNEPRAPTIKDKQNKSKSKQTCLSSCFSFW